MAREHDWQRLSGMWPIETCGGCRLQRRRGGDSSCSYLYRASSREEASLDSVFWSFQVQEPPCNPEMAVQSGALPWD